MYSSANLIREHEAYLKMASDRVKQLKKAIETGHKNPQEYLKKLQLRSQQLTCELILKNPNKLKGQSCAYIGGFPV